MKIAKKNNEMINQSKIKFAYQRRKYDKGKEKLKLNYGKGGGRRLTLFFDVIAAVEAGTEAINGLSGSSNP